MYIDIKMLLDTYILSNIESWPENNLNTSRWKIAQFYDECLQFGTSEKQWGTKLR